MKFNPVLTKWYLILPILKNLLEFKGRVSLFYNNFLTQRVTFIIKWSKRTVSYKKKVITELKITKIEQNNLIIAYDE